MRESSLPDIIGVGSLEERKRLINVNVVRWVVRRTTSVSALPVSSPETRSKFGDANFRRTNETLPETGSLGVGLGTYVLVGFVV